MQLPNLLATRRGRLFAFFSLYVTEGIPLGFAATAVATQLRRQGVGPAEIGAFVASFYLPWRRGLRPFVCKDFGLVNISLTTEFLNHRSGLLESPPLPSVLLHSVF